MRCERLTLGAAAGAAESVTRELRSLISTDPTIPGRAAEIVERVRTGGDAALAALAAEHDGVAPGTPLRVGEDELAAAERALDPELGAALELAISNVRAVALAGLSAEQTEVDLPQGHLVRLRELPVGSAGLYVPGGRAPYPSTVVMGAVTAQVAGVPRIAVCAPAAHSSILAACALCGVSEVYRAGGAHAIAALAHGTESIARVDVVAGPGNEWVQAAKLLVSGSVGIDGLLGPSDVMVLASGDASGEQVALDLLAQAEHGPGTIVVAVSDDGGLLDDIAARLEQAADTGASAALVAVADPGAALATAEAFAPEHLELQGEAMQALAPDVTRAGCVFVGPAGATAFGDYVAGSNHSLPTGGTARFASALSPRHFRRRMAEVHIRSDAAAALAPPGAAIARAEGFEQHARSMEARVRQNPPAST